MMNADSNQIIFQMPGAFEWQLHYDSFDPAIAPHPLTEDSYKMEGRTVALLTAMVRL
jgi:hypothetical protein